jgi:hypothetical protein
MTQITFKHIIEPVWHYEVGVFSDSGEHTIEWFGSEILADRRYQALLRESHRRTRRAVKMLINEDAEYSAEWGMYEGPRVAIVKILSDEMSPIFRFAFTSEAFGHTVEVWQASHFKPQYHRMDE